MNRPRTWLSLFADLEVTNAQNFDLEQFNEDSPEQQRKIEILSSLIIGSINDPNKVTLEVPDTLIKKIKNKIILYDGNESSFIYQDVNPNKVIRIQGLAGTGKTELLIQKIRDKYVNEKNSKIVYACYNQVLEVLPFKAGVRIMRLLKFFHDLENQQITVLLNHSTVLSEMNV